MAIDDKKFSQIISEKRHCESAWFIIQAKKLTDLAKEFKSTSALVYAALEARNAVEQLWFELIRTCHRVEISKELLEECRKTDGIFRVMQETEPDYRKLVRFVSICGLVDKKMPKVIEWDLKRLKHFWHSLSKYCHSPMKPDDTFESTEWFNEGVSLIYEIYQYMSSNMERAFTGIMTLQSMPEEVRHVWEDFKSNSLSEDDLSLRLKIMSPVLEIRKYKK